MASPTQIALGLSLATLIAPIARAEPGPADRPPTAVEEARHRDASIDRGFLTAHADTIGAGNWALNSYELLFLGVSYAPTDDFELALSTSLPVAEGFPIFGALAPKLVFYRSRDTVAAVRAVIWYGSIIGENDGLGSFSVGVHLDQYLDGRGRVALHASLAGGTAFGTGFSGSDFSLASGALLQLDLGLTVGVASVAKLLFETQIFAAKTNGEFNVAPVVLLNYGIRFHGPGLAADLGFMRPLGDVDTDLILGVPFVAFSARF